MTFVNRLENNMFVSGQSEQIVLIMSLSKWEFSARSLPGSKQD